jgi:hypothetical protein
VRPVLQTVVRGPDGAAAPGASVRVLLRGVNFEISTYADASGGSPLTQPIIADSEGRIQVYGAGPGQFDIESTVNGVVTTQPVDLHPAGIDDWTTPTFTNGFTTSAPPWPPVAYTKDSEGVVHLRGLVAVGSGAVGSSMFTLPSGYRPTGGTRRFCVASFGSNPALHITTAGLVVPQAGIAVWFLDGVRFMP